MIVRVEIRDLPNGTAGVLTLARQTKYPSRVVVIGQDPQAVNDEIQRLISLIESGGDLPSARIDLD